jgi:UDPglucose 6-dehydrogenase
MKNDVLETEASAGLRLKVMRVVEANTFFNSKVLHSFSDFKCLADFIISNRMYEGLSKVAEKVFTRDLYGRD